MLKECWRDNIDLFVMMHGSMLFDSNIPSLEKQKRCLSSQRHLIIGEGFINMPFSIMFK